MPLSQWPAKFRDDEDDRDPDWVEANFDQLGQSCETIARQVQVIRELSEENGNLKSEVATLKRRLAASCEAHLE